MPTTHTRRHTCSFSCFLFFVCRNTETRKITPHRAYQGIQRYPGVSRGMKSFRRRAGDALFIMAPLAVVGPPMFGLAYWTGKREQRAYNDRVQQVTCNAGLQELAKDVWVRQWVRDMGSMNSAFSSYSPDRVVDVEESIISETPHYRLPTVCTHKHRHPPAPCEQGFLPENIACLSV